MRTKAGLLLWVLAWGGLLGVGTFLVTRSDNPAPPAAAPSTTVAAPSTTMPPPTTTTVPPPTTTTTEVLVREPGTVPGWTVGRPWGAITGLTMFRGNPTRTFYGSEPPSAAPTQAWRYPEDPMCRRSSIGGEMRLWCGLGWTGQPVVWERPDGVTEVIFGAFDGAVHFVDAQTGEDLRAEFQTGDIIKGSVTLDPDGYPLLYFGSRDNKLRILGLDRDPPEQLWSLDAYEVRVVWNDDWDSNPVIVDDIMYEGGENGWLFAVRLNRSYDDQGRVTVDPEILLTMPGFNDELLSKSGRNVSIETSVVLYEQRLYFANSGGRIVGIDVSDIGSGEAPVVFDYYAGGDIDATMVVDSEGMLYAGIEYEPAEMGSVEKTRNKEVGQLIKLDPYREGDPLVWGLDLTAGGSDAGIWASPAFYQGVLYVGTNQGDLLAVDTEDGEVVWSDEVGWHAWSSPAVAGELLVVATCTGDIRGYSVADPRKPVLLWTIDVGEACIEATPIIWDGAIYIGSRDGYFRAFR